MNKYLRLQQIRLPIIGLMLVIIMGVAVHPSPVDAAPEPVSTPNTSLTETAPSPSWTQQDLNDLAAAIYAKAGATWIPDDIQLYVGSVVLNRVAHDRFPNTIQEVINAKNQYNIDYDDPELTPDDRTLDNARWLLDNGSILPANVVFQSNEIQGDGIYYTYDDPILGPTYFCFIND